MARINSPDELKYFRETLAAQKDPEKPCVSICAGAGCVASGANDVLAAFREEIDRQGLSANVDTKGTGCPGFCERGPVLVIHPEEICYLGVTVEDVPDIVEKTIKQKQVVERLLYKDPATGEHAVHENDIPFYKHQKRHLISSNIWIDSKSIDDYLAIDGTDQGPVRHVS